MFQIVYSGYWLRVSSYQNPSLIGGQEVDVYTIDTSCPPSPRNQQGTCVVANYGGVFSFSPKI